MMMGPEVYLALRAGFYIVKFFGINIKRVQPESSSRPQSMEARLYSVFWTHPIYHEKIKITVNNAKELD